MGWSIVIIGFVDFNLCEVGFGTGSDLTMDSLWVVHIRVGFDLRVFRVCVLYGFYYEMSYDFDVAYWLKILY